MSKIIITTLPYQGHKLCISAWADENGPAELRILPPKEKNLLGNIYVAQVENLAENIQAAFVQIEKGVRCYLPYEELDHAIYTNKKHPGSLRPGDELLVQVKREAMKSKLPCVTANLNFTGKYIVLTSGNRRLGFSSKLAKEDKDRIKSWLEQEPRDSYGLVVRTNAAQAGREEFMAEWKVLKTRYEKVISYGTRRTCFSLVDEAQSPVLAAIRDTYTQDLEEILTDDPDIYEQILAYLNLYQGEDGQKLRLYQDKLLPLYKLYRLEHALEQASKERVWLKSGGFLVIEPTEAFVSIDVNTGKYVEKKKIQETFRKINKEAAQEIARQLRLRNLSGIILIDFINMESREHQEELLHVLQKYFRKDPVNTQVVDMTPLHIVEVTRKKVRRSLAEELAEAAVYQEELLC